MKYLHCRQCGAAVSNDYEFCPKCGASLHPEVVKLDMNSFASQKKATNLMYAAIDASLTQFHMIVALSILGGIGLIAAQFFPFFIIIGQPVKIVELGSLIGNQTIGYDTLVILPLDLAALILIIAGLNFVFISRLPPRWGFYIADGLVLLAFIVIYITYMQVSEILGIYSFAFFAFGMGAAIFGFSFFAMFIVTILARTHSRKFEGIREQKRNS